MKVLIMPRARGKTHNAILESAKTQAIIICTGSKEAQKVKKLALSLNVDIPEPLSYMDANIKLKGISRKIIIDNLSDVLFGIFGKEIHAVTINGSSQEEICELSIGRNQRFSWYKTGCGRELQAIGGQWPFTFCPFCGRKLSQEKIC